MCLYFIETLEVDQYSQMIHAVYDQQSTLPEVQSQEALRVEGRRGEEIRAKRCCTRAEKHVKEWLEVTRRDGEVDVPFWRARGNPNRTKRHRTRAVRHVRVGLEYSIFEEARL